MTAYAPPTASPHPPNADGRPADMTRLTRASISSMIRTGIWSGSSQFVTQVVYAQASQTMANSSRARSAPAAVG